MVLGLLHCRVRNLYVLTSWKAIKANTLNFTFINRSGETTLKLNAPDTITTWQVNAVALSSQTGIGIAPPRSILSTKKFFVEFTLPYSVIRGEQIKIPLTVHNYLDQCITVSNYT